MRAYDFSTHNKTVKRDRSRYFTYAFIFLLASAFAAFIYYVVLNSPRILFYFRENKYSEIERLHARALEAVISEKRSETPQKKATLIEVTEFLDLAHALQKDHRDDAILYFHEATLLDEMVRRQLSVEPQALVGLMFREFISRPAFPPEFDHDLWQRAILTGRRARALGAGGSLNEILLQKLTEAEIEVYLIGGKPWWESAHDLTANMPGARKLPAWHLIEAGLSTSTPDFELIKAAYGTMIAGFAKGVYYMKAGNSPLGISNFRDLSQNQADAVTRDYALYALGYLSGREKRVKDQLYYYKQIRFPEFAPANPYYVAEYHYLLRFLGQKSEADQLMRAWEEMKTQKTE